MHLINFHNTTLNILISDLEYPFEKEGKHMLCEDVSVFHSDPNSRSIYLKRESGGRYLMDIDDIIDELGKFEDSKIKWRCKERRQKLLNYYTKVFLIMKTYRREEKINKIINGSEWTLCLAC